MNTACMFSSKTDEWYTPQEFFDELDGEFHFVLDAAADETNAKCSRYYDKSADGLSKPWQAGGGGLVQSSVWPGDREVGPQGV